MQDICEETKALVYVCEAIHGLLHTSLSNLKIETSSNSAVLIC